MKTESQKTGSEIPGYDVLLNRTDAPAGSSWGVFGSDDELGSINFMTPERVVDALKLATRGDIFTLDYELNAFPPNANRGSAQHVIFGKHEDQRDDYLDSFYLQSTSQIDGLRHRRHTVHGFYNGFPDHTVDVGTETLGIQHWATTGIVGRGVLIDVERYLATQGKSLDYENGEAFTVDVLDKAAAEQGVEVRPGDIVLMRTGWAGWFLGSVPEEERIARRAKGAPTPGLIQSRDTAAWLWNHQVTMIAADNAAVEAVPVADPEPFFTETDKGLMHQELIAMLGIALGELFKLDELAADCAEDGRYDFAFVSKPLALRGGVGSTANALAIK